MNAAEQIRLVKKAVKGDPDAYGRLITEHQEYLYKMAYLYVRNEETALDVVGSTILSAYQSIRALKEPEYFKTWITRILIRAAQSEQKKIVFYGDLDHVKAPERYTGVSLEEKCDLNSAIEQLSEKYRVYNKGNSLCHECPGRFCKGVSQQGKRRIEANIEGGLYICKLILTISAFQQKN